MEIRIASAIIGYLIASVSFTWIYAKLRYGITMRESLTWSRLYRLKGKEAWPAAVGEVLKGTLAAYLAYHISGRDQWAIVFAGIGAIMGHSHSLYFGFRGGKSMSVGSGVLLFIGLQEPLLLLIMLVAMLIGGAMWASTDVVSTGSLSAATVTLISVLAAHILLHRLARPYVFFVVLGVSIIYLLFRENIWRLAQGKEHKTPFPFRR